MKKLKRSRRTAAGIIAGAMGLSVIGLTGCRPEDNLPVAVYSGPSTPNIDPKINSTAPVYGPPEWFENPVEPLPADPENETGLPSGVSGFDPSENEPVDVYGPPEWFDGSEEEPAAEESAEQGEGQD